MSSTVRTPRILGLDVLRALAIILVVVAHGWPTKSWNHWANALAVIGVELFFVLSGYLIGSIIIRLIATGQFSTGRNLLNFWRRRWLRTLPNYYLFLTLHLAYLMWLGFSDAVWNEQQYFVFAQNLAWAPDLFFPQSWSLAVEEWFYLLFPLLIWGTLRLGRGHWLAWVLSVGLFFVGPWFFRVQAVHEVLLETPDAGNLFVELRGFWDGHVRVAVIYRLDAVMYGVIAALVAAKRPHWWNLLVNWWPIGAATVLLVLASIALNAPLDRGTYWGGLLLWPIMGTGIALLLPKCSQWINGSGWFAGAARYTARISYALYLCHALILVIISRMFPRKSFWYLAPHTLSWSIVGITLSVMVAWIVYRWFEKPIMDRGAYYKV